MLSSEDIEQQQKLLSIHRRTLAALLQTQAMFGSLYTPPHITLGIDDARENIRVIKNTLLSGGITVTDRPDDEPIVDCNPSEIDVPKKNESQLYEWTTILQENAISLKLDSQLVSLSKAFINRRFQGRFSIAIVGQFKSGKSTLLNALLGKEVSPVELLPCTAVPIRVKYGNRLFANLVFRSLPNSLPEVQEIQLSEVEQFASFEGTQYGMHRNMAL